MASIVTLLMIPRHAREPRRRDVPVEGDPEADFHGQRRSNETHASTTDPDARLYRERPGKEAKLCFMGYALMENSNGLVVDDCLESGDMSSAPIASATCRSRFRSTRK